MKFFKELIAVLVGGGIGSVARFLLSRSIQTIIHFQEFPLGILVVNLLGCLIIGIVAGFLSVRAVWSPVLRTGIIIGCLGGFTTFSSFTLDSITLWQNGDYLGLIYNIGLSVLGGLLFTAVGYILAQKLF